MKNLLLYLRKILPLLLYIALAVPIYAYLTFYFVYPIVCIIPISVPSATGYFYVLYSFLMGIMMGIIVEEGQYAFICTFSSAILGYLLSYAYISFPAYIYGFTLYASDIQAIFFISRTWFLLFIYIIFGVFGIIIGGVLRNYLEESEY